MIQCNNRKMSQSNMFRVSNRELSANIKHGRLNHLNWIELSFKWGGGLRRVDKLRSLCVKNVHNCSAWSIESLNKVKMLHLLVKIHGPLSPLLAHYELPCPLTCCEVIIQLRQVEQRRCNGPIFTPVATVGLKHLNGQRQRNTTLFS